MLRVGSAGFFLACTTIFLLAQQEPVQNPHTSPADAKAGARIFRVHCAHCHGFEGEGDRGPDLTRGEFRYGSSDADLFRTITSGIPQSGMPHLSLPEKQIWQLVTFVRSLSRNAGPATVSGNPDLGRTLFYGKGDCGRCHMVQGSGGRLGPDLSDIGRLRSPEYLRSSIISPDEQIDRRYWSLHVIDHTGRAISGIRLNEDTFSIQLADFEGNLYSLWKADLREMRQEKKSWMPGYEGVLSPGELEDLVAYLYSLRSEERRQ